MQRLCLLSLMGIFLLSFVSAQDWTITARWDIQALPSLDGHLIAPDGNQNFTNLEPSETIVSELTKQQTWKFQNPPPGRTRFFLINQAEDDEFADWAGFRWLDMVEVKVTGPGVSKRFSPPEGAGALWYVFDIIGDDQFLQPTMQILPRRQSIYGHITDASTSVPIQNVTVEIFDPVDNRLIGRDKTTSSGLYLFFLDQGTYKIKVSSRDYIMLEEKLDTKGFSFPRRRDFNLSRELRDPQIRVVLSWDYYPPNLDIFWENSSSKPGVNPLNDPKLVWEFAGAQAFSNESLLIDSLPETTSRLVVEPTPASGADHILLYASARIKVYKDNMELMTITPEGGSGTRWEVFDINPDGTIKVLNQLVKP